MARSAVERGYDVVVYARREAGLPHVEEHDGFRLVRVESDWRMAWPVLRRFVRDSSAVPDDDATESAPPRTPPGGATADRRAGALANLRRGIGRVRRRLLRPVRRWSGILVMFPLRPLGWAAALRAQAEPADVWHGMWAISLPALLAMQRRHGGRTIYDSRDVYMRSRVFAVAGNPGRAILERLERRWSHRVDRVITVNEAYADLLVQQLEIARPRVVMNCPVRWDPPVPPFDLIRSRLGLPATVRIALYQGHLKADRGIEQSMEAILEVPDAVLVLLGMGPWTSRFTRQTTDPPYLGKVFVLPAVPPDQLLSWTNSADASVMAIQPTSDNHRYTTPQKLFESLAAGVPVVASDMPGMRDIVVETGAGELCDPTDPASIAAAIRSILDVDDEERRRRRAQALAAAHDRYHWEAEVDELFDVYADLLGATATDR